VVVGVRVRVPALFHPAVVLKGPGDVMDRGCVGVVVPFRLLKMNDVFVIVLTDEMQLVNIGVVLDKIIVMVFPAQGFGVLWDIVTLTTMGLILSGKASPATDTIPASPFASL